jgi:hypothetical protein
MSGSKAARYVGAAACALAFAGPAGAVVMFDQDVTNAAIYGSGNANGGWTVDRNAQSGMELGLRAHVRYDLADDQPKNIFNSNGDGTYNHAAGAPASNLNRARWNFDFSINSNYNTQGQNLEGLRFVLQMDHNPTAATNFVSIDLFNQHFDHSFGNNGTAEGDGTEAIDLTAFNALRTSSNLAQNSWNMDFFDPALFGFDPTADGTYSFTLQGFRSNTLLAQTSIDVIVGAGGATVPVPATLALLVPGLLGLGWQFRRRA